MLHPTEQLRMRGPVSNAAGILPEHLYWFVMQLLGTISFLELNFWFNFCLFVCLILNKYLKNGLLAFLKISVMQAEVTSTVAAELFSTNVT